MNAKSTKSIELGLMEDEAWLLIDLLGGTTGVTQAEEDFRCTLLAILTSLVGEK